VPGYFYVNDEIKSLLFEELNQQVRSSGTGGFLPAVSMALKFQFEEF
jgi:hypothetical protein